jgi:hypothetical protein
MSKEKLNDGKEFVTAKDLDLKKIRQIMAALKDDKRFLTLTNKQTADLFWESIKNLEPEKRDAVVRSVLKKGAVEYGVDSEV